jgi:subtilisin family serine protease
MKYIILVIALTALCLNVGFSKNTLSMDGYVLYKRYVEATDATKQTALRSEYMLRGPENNPTIGAIIRYDAKLDKAKLKTLGVLPQLDFDTIMTCIVPVRNLLKISEFDGIIRIETDTKLRPYLDKALPSANVLEGQNGQIDGVQYDGTGVIVGIIDIGFDFTHPMFNDTNGNSRIKRVWNAIYNGYNPPAGFNKGTLYTDSSIIRDSLQHSEYIVTHGTSVAAVAAGLNENGFGSSTGYGGVAPNADIAMVEVYGISEDINALDYIFSYADSVGKPCVVNLSSGYMPLDYLNDEMSSCDILFRNVLNKHKKEGRIFCAAAGNGIGENHHFQTTISNNDECVTNLPFDSAYTHYRFSAVANEGEDFLLSFVVTDDAGNDWYSPVFRASESYYSDTNLFTDVAERNATLIIETGIGGNNGSNRPSVKVWLMNFNDLPLHIRYTITSENAHIHSWTEPYAEAISGGHTIDMKYAVGPPADMSEIISVGSYNTRNQLPMVVFWDSLDFSDQYTIEDHSYFSVFGPNMNGDIKPDIMAPGAFTIAAANKFCETFGQYTTDLDENGKPKYVAAAGTSLSSPFVVGCVALALQKNPNITMDEMKTLLQKTAKNDEFTGNVRNNKSTTWGWGKINLISLLNEIKVGIHEPSKISTFRLYPNPVVKNANIRFSLVKPADVIISISDILGNEVMKLENTYDTGEQNISINVDALAKGSYICSILIGGTRAATTQFVISE